MAKQVSLPKHPSNPEEDLGAYSILIYGREKIGKTDLAAQFPKAFFLMCEPGGKSLRIFQRPVTSWRQFKQYVELLNENPDYCKTVVVDTVDLAFKLCTRYICRLLGVPHVSEDKNYGRAYDMIRDEFAEQMQLLLPGRGVIFVSHEEEKSLPTDRGDTERSRTIPTMPKQARKVIEPMVDIWAYYHYDDEGNRVLRIRGNKFVSAGCRLKENFVGVSKISMGNSAEEGYRNFIRAFGTRGTRTSNPEKSRVVIRSK